MLDPNQVRVLGVRLANMVGLLTASQQQIREGMGITLPKSRTADTWGVIRKNRSRWV